MPKGMFTELMEADEKKDRQVEPVKPKPIARKESPPPDDLLPGALEDLSEVGYNSHSYRFTESEIRWLRRFCLRAAERLDRQISHNTFVRLLLRLADEEWNDNPNSNRLLKLLSNLKD